MRLRPLAVVGGGLAIAAAAAGTLYFTSRARCFQWTGGDAICRVETDEPIVALSFDDGPTEWDVDQLLATLEAADVRATFFLIGRQMRAFPGQARRLAEAGHEIGNHSDSHVPLVARSAAFIDAEIAATDALLRAEGVEHPRLFRPPYGMKLFGLPRAVERAGYRTIMWDVEDQSGSTEPPEDYAAAIVAAARPGSIILMHPMYRHNASARAALPMILEGLKAKGLRVVTVGELIEAGERARGREASAP